MIMLAEGRTADEAFERLRTCSQHANRKVADIARELVESSTSGDRTELSTILDQLVSGAR